MTLPNGLATVASLQLSAYFALGWGPAGPPVGFLDSLTYYVENEQLTVCIHPRWNEADLDGLRGPLYEHQPVVGFKDGIVTRPADYIGYLGTDINSYTPGQPLSESAADMRPVRTGWLSTEEAAAQDAQTCAALGVETLPVSDAVLLSGETTCPDTCPCLHEQ